MATFKYGDKLVMVHFFDGSILFRKEWAAEEDGLIPAPLVYAFGNADAMYRNKWAARIINHAVMS